MAAIAILAAFGSFEPAGAERIGVTSAVNPAARGTPPGGAVRVLTVGLDMVQDERIETDPAGQTHLLFVDGSTLTVGPNSDLVLDRFVYDPDSKTGELALSTTKGLLRFVGGRISKSGGVRIKTPSATIGIRGGIALIQTLAGGASTATLLFGDEMKMESGGVTKRLKRSGYQMTSGAADQPPSDPTPAPEGDVLAALDALEGGGGGGTEGQVTDDDIAQSGVGDDGGDPAALAETETETEGGALETALDNDLSAEVADASQDDTVETSAEELAADLGLDFAAIVGAEAGAAAGAAGGAAAAAAQITNFVGRAKFDADTLNGTDDATVASNLGLAQGDIVIANGVLTATTSQGNYSLFFPATVGEFALGGASGNGPASTPFGDVTGFVTTEESVPGGGIDVVFYELTGASRQILFAGVPSAAIPAAGLTRYLLDGDFALDGDPGARIPFIQIPTGVAFTVPNDPEALVFFDSPALNATVTERGFLASNLTINGQGAAQISAASVIAGTIFDDTVGVGHLQADMRGSGRFASTQQSQFFFGNASTADSGDGFDFVGQNAAFFVLEGSGNGSLVSTVDDIVERGITRRDGVTSTTFFPNVTGERLAQDVVGTRTNQSVFGYGAGAFEVIDAGGLLSDSVFFLNSSRAADLVSATNPDNSSITTTLILQDPSVEGLPDVLTLKFGQADDQRGLFIDDARFGAQEVGLSTIDPDGTGPSPAVAFADERLYLTTNHGLQTVDFFPAGVSFCACQFSVTGFFGGNLIASPDRRIHLATFVQGPQAFAADVATLVGTATFTGHAIGTVEKGVAPNVFLAVGQFVMVYDFSSDTGTMTINNYDGVNYAGTAAAFSFSFQNEFNLVFAGGGNSGVGEGTFIQGGGLTAAEAIGEFHISGPNFESAGTIQSKADGPPVPPS